MILPLDLRCLECGLIFCCANCRRVHESKKHGITFDCRICRFGPLYWNSASPLPEDLMAHICCTHLPLGCGKCGKVICNKEELSEKGKCVAKVEIEEPALPTPPPEHPSPPDLAPNVGPLFAYLKLKMEDKSEVMTSTPTHPSTGAKWGMFQKSFTSTLSGINSPGSDAAPSPPADEQKVTSQMISSIDSPPSAPEMAPPKSIMSKSGRDSLGGPDDGNTSEPAAAACDSSSSNKTPTDSSCSKKKSVTFADDVLIKKRVAAIEYLKPKRTATPGRTRPRHTRTPRFQAMINNFESRASRDCTTPKQNRFSNPDETPPTTAEPNTNVITARAINFKPNDSPTFEDLKVSPITEMKDEPLKLKKRSNSFSVLSPRESEMSSLDHYKSCIADSPETANAVSPLGRGNDLSQLIAKSIQETLSTAFSAQDCSTEIQLSIKITKRTVSIKESTKTVESGTGDAETDGRLNNQVENQSTTIWSRLVSGLKWVVWGERKGWNGSPKGITEPGGVSFENDPSTEALMLSGSKRKRHVSYLGESPVSKRYRYSERIHGRRPIDRMLRSRVVLPERCQSSDTSAIPSLTENTKEDVASLNRSF